MSVEPLKERIEKKKNVVYLSKILKIVLSKKNLLKKSKNLILQISIIISLLFPVLMTQTNIYGVSLPI